MTDSKDTYRTITPYLVVRDADAELAFLKAEFALDLWVDDVDATYARALEAGATSQSAPEDKPYGHRNTGVIDQNCVTWWLAAPVQ